jgi:hypothetical protein
MMDFSVSGRPTNLENESKHGPGGPNNGAAQDAWEYWIVATPIIPIANITKILIFIFCLCIIIKENLTVYVNWKIMQCNSLSTLKHCLVCSLDKIQRNKNSYDVCKWNGPPYSWGAEEMRKCHQANYDKNKVI